MGNIKQVDYLMVLSNSDSVSRQLYHVDYLPQYCFEVVHSQNLVSERLSQMDFESRQKFLRLSAGCTFLGTDLIDVDVVL